MDILVLRPLSRKSWFGRMMSDCVWRLLSVVCRMLYVQTDFKKIWYVVLFWAYLGKFFIF